MKACRFRLLFLVSLLLSLLPAMILGYDADIGEAAKKYIKPLEAVMIDGPFQVGGRPYYTMEYLYMGEGRETLVYGSVEGDFITDRELIKKVFLKN